MNYEKQTIHGQPPSKSNSYRIVRIAGRAALCKTPQLKKYEESFFMQCSLRGRKIGRRFKLSVDIYYRSDLPDLDNGLKVILDCLQSCKAIKNDRLCAEIDARKLIDKESPRIEFTIEEYGQEG